MLVETNETSPAAPAGPRKGSGTGGEQRNRLIWSGVVAAVVFLLLETVSDFIATPLREVSSVLVEFFLSTVGFPIVRHGTILSTSRVTFDVVPACSGSTTLQVLLFLGIVWCGIHPRLTPIRRFAAVLISVPLALASNMVRVSALVFMGHLAGAPPGDVLHVLVGIATFAVALVICIALTDRLAVLGETSGGGRPLGAVLLAGFLLLITAPFAVWCVQGWWGGELDRFGFVFVLVGGGWAAWRGWKAPDDSTCRVSGTVAFGAALLLLVLATLLDVNIAKGMAVLAVVWTLVLRFKGPRFARGIVPLLLIAYLGFPTVSYQLQTVAVPLFGTGSRAVCMILKIVLAVVLAVSTRLSVLRWRLGDSRPEPSPRLQHLPLLMAAGVAVFQVVYYGWGESDSSLGTLNMSYLQGSWVGRNHAISTTGEDFFKGRIWSRRYVSGSRDVDVLVTSTGGDRHRAHPPEYCMTGNGWKVVSSRATEGALGNGLRVPMTRIHLDRDGENLAFVYWFTDGTEVHRSYSGMLLRDTLRRVAGRRTDWFLFRVMSASGADVLEDFLTTFEVEVVGAGPGGRSGN